MTGDPIDRIVWRAAGELHTNGWNPNIVHSPELRLLETSILETGWVQPILVSPESTIIDGEHRVHLAKTSKELQRRYGGLVPTAIVNVTEAEARMLTVRINRAKGTHVAQSMSELVKAVMAEGVSREEVGRLIGATLDEVDLLNEGDLFVTRKLDERPYSKAWYPAESTARAAAAAAIAVDDDDGAP